MRFFRFVSVGAALLAVVALSAMAMGPSASAAVTFLLAFWLEGGNDVAATVLVLLMSELLLEDERGVEGVMSLQKCSIDEDGSVGPDSADEITEMLTLEEVAVSLTPLAGTAITCELEAVCQNSSKVWLMNLPNLTEIELWEEGAESGFVDIILGHSGGGNPGWYIECATILPIVEECTSPEIFVSQVNIATGVEGFFSGGFTLLMGGNLMLCSSGSEGFGDIEGTEVTTIQGGGVLSVSSA